MTESPKPISVISNVWEAWNQIASQNSMPAATIRDGVGRMNSGMLKRRHKPSQSTRSAAITSHGISLPRVSLLMPPPRRHQRDKVRFFDS